MTDPTSILAALYGEDLAAKIAAERAAERQATEDLRATTLIHLRAVGATEVTATYEGGNDSGAVVIQSVTAGDQTIDTEALVVPMPTSRWNAELGRFDEAVEQRPIDAAIERVLSGVLTDRVGNWWDGDIETDGTITWHLAEQPDRISGEHRHVVRESQHDEWED